MSSPVLSSPMHLLKWLQKMSSTIPIATCPSNAGKIPNGANNGWPLPSGPGMIPS